MGLGSCTTVRHSILSLEQGRIHMVAQLYAVLQEMLRTSMQHERIYTAVLLHDIPYGVQNASALKLLFSRAWCPEREHVYTAIHLRTPAHGVQNAMDMQYGVQNVGALELLDSRAWCPERERSPVHGVQNTSVWCSEHNGHTIWCPEHEQYCAILPMVSRMRVAQQFNGAVFH
jgi:hypothetical protein